MNGPAQPIRYSMIIEWDPRDDIFVVTVPELPGCQTHGATYEEAVQQGQDAIESWLGFTEEERRGAPPPRFFDDDRWTWSQAEPVEELAQTAR